MELDTATLEEETMDSANDTSDSISAATWTEETEGATEEESAKAKPSVRRARLAASIYIRDTLPKVTGSPANDTITAAKRAQRESEENWEAGQTLITQYFSVGKQGANFAKSVQKAEKEPADSDSAVRMMWENYELVEMVLLSLPDAGGLESVKMVLLAQRVSKTFEHAIKRSTKLQQMLFSKPKYVVGKGKIGWNPLLKRAGGTVIDDSSDDLGIGSAIGIYADEDRHLFDMPFVYTKQQPAAELWLGGVEDWRRMLLRQGIEMSRMLLWEENTLAAYNERVKQQMTMNAVWRMLQ